MTDQDRPDDITPQGGPHATTVYSVRDMASAERLMNRLIMPHRIFFAGAPGDVDLDLRHFAFRGVNVMDVHFGADIDIDPGSMDDRYTVEIARHGSLGMIAGKDMVSSDIGSGIVISPEVPIRIRKRNGCASIAVFLERPRVEKYLVNYLGAALREPIRFAPFIDARRAPGRSWKSVVDMIITEWTSGASLFANGPAQTELENLLIGTLIQAQHNNYSDRLTPPATGPLPYYVKRVEEYIAAHADEAIVLDDLVRVSGVSGATLSSAFRRHRRMTPMAFVREVRLTRCRAALQAGTPDETQVTDIALKWGFTHLGRFSQYYFARFGELPSDTLRFRH